MRKYLPAILIVFTICFANGQTDLVQQMELIHNRQVSQFLFAINILIGILLIGFYIFYRRNQQDKQLIQEQGEEISRQEDEINHLNLDLEAKNISLELLNRKLLSEITEREGIERSSFARDRFLATMSNQMRTPLNAITGLSHVLLNENPREDQVEQLRNLQFAANDLVVYINDMLDFSKIEVGKLHLEDREFSPQKAVNEVQKRFLDKADKKGQPFHFYFDPNIPEKLLGDDARFEQILINLLTGTLKQTKEGEVEFAITLHDLRAKDVMLKITILGTDGGVGKQTIEKMFNPQQAINADFEGYDKQQFSLAITKRLVELQNGKIEVEVTPEDHTKFTVLLPFKLVLDQRSNQKQFNGIKDNSFEGTHVLVVEDNKINQLVVSKMLKKAGIEVTLANNGFEALTKVEAQDFDLILMDIQMPEMDGYRTTAEIRRHRKEHKRSIPIIALTASAFLTEKEKAVLFGMNDHVGKPFSLDELMEKIKNCLQVHSGE